MHESYLKNYKTDVHGPKWPKTKTNVILRVTGNRTDWFWETVNEKLRQHLKSFISGHEYFSHHWTVHLFEELHNYLHPTSEREHTTLNAFQKSPCKKRINAVPIQSMGVLRIGATIEQKFPTFINYCIRNNARPYFITLSSNILELHKKKRKTNENNLMTKAVRRLLTLRGHTSYQVRSYVE